MTGHRELLHLKRDRLIKKMVAPSGCSGRDGGYRSTGQGGTGQAGSERALTAPVRNDGDSSVAWTQRDFEGIGARLRELERQKDAALRGTPQTCEELDCFLIYFDSDSTEVRGQRDVLDRTVRAIMADEDMGQVTVTGHTDRHGSYHENMSLGAVRAISVKWLLVIRGVPEHRISCHSSGFTDPRRSSDPMLESADILNRRVEIRIKS